MRGVVERPRAERPHLLVAALASALVLSGCLFGGKDKEGGPGAASPWLVGELDLGTDRATGTGFVIGNGDDLWFAAEQFVPELRHTYPASSIPLYVWEEIAMGENIADIGSCPYTIVEDGAQVWRSDCRSQEGYEWSGEVSVDEWEDSTGRWTRWDMDLEIIGDIEDPAFDRLTLDGSIAFVAGDGEELVRGVQANMLTGLDGWFEQHNVTDQRESAWQDWVVTGRYEEYPEGHSFAGAVDLGELGGMTFEADGLDTVTSCPAEPKGDLYIQADREAILEFDGSDSCNRCGDMVMEGEFAGQACGTG